MATKVGPKGQVVIEQAIRQALGVKPGALAIQRLVGERVEIQFVPAPHEDSLLGALAPYVRRWPTGDIDDTEGAWTEEVRRHVPGEPEE